MENLSEILNWVFGGTSLIGVVTTIVFWRKTKRKEEAATQVAEAEADQSNIETQKQKIELGNKYMEDTLKMVEMVKQSLDRGEGNQEKIMEKLDEHGKKLDLIDERVDKQDARLADIVTYLNGDFQEFLKRTHGKEEGDGQQE